MYVSSVCHQKDRFNSSAVILLQLVALTAVVTVVTVTVLKLCRCKIYVNFLPKFFAVTSLFCVGITPHLKKI